MKAAGHMRFFLTAAMAIALAMFAQMEAGLAARESTTDPVRGHAEGLAEAASKEFSVILERQRLAQAQTSKPDAGPAAKLDHAVGPPLSWFRKSSREFQALMGMLAGGAPASRSWDPVADAEKKAAASKTDASQVAQPPPRASAAGAVC